MDIASLSARAECVALENVIVATVDASGRCAISAS
jgi:hypothetical protein